MASILTKESINFARNHIDSFYDTDFFPKPFEFKAIWFKWEAVVELLISKNLEQTFEAPPVAAPWKKTRGGYRIVHELEPLDSVIYTALAFMIAEQVEKKRADEFVACSYRIEIDDASFFTSGSGFSRYRIGCEELAEEYKYVLATDISDFYNQLYLHRLQNAIEIATDDPKIASVIENFLNRLNTKASQGVPVGPAASIIMSEASLIDVDQFLQNHGFKHVRYVDDFRIFGNSMQELDSLLQELSLYLYENHRLSLSSEKTKIMKSDDFLQKELNNHYQLEKIEILEEIEIINPYSMEVVDVDYVLVENAGQSLLDALERIIKFENLDLGVARAIIRRAKANRIQEIAHFLLKNIDFFTPVINDVVLYLDHITDDEFINKYSSTFSDMCEKKHFHSQMVGFWMEWYLSKHFGYLKSKDIKQFLYSSKNVITQARAAVTEKNVAWVRSKKTQLLHFATWDRRAIIFSAQILSKDERTNWLRPFLKSNAITDLEKWVSEWVIEGCPDSAGIWDGEDFSVEISF